MTEQQQQQQMKRNVCMEARSRALINMSFLWFYDTFTKRLICIPKSAYTHTCWEKWMSICTHTNICHAEDAFLTAMLHIRLLWFRKLNCFKRFSHLIYCTQTHTRSLQTFQVGTTRWSEAFIWIIVSEKVSHTHTQKTLTRPPYSNRFS